MTSDQVVLLNKIRRLSYALIVSGALNIGVLGLLSYSMIYERPPTPYCEMKPAVAGQVSFVDDRGNVAIIAQLHKLPYQQLIARLNQTQQIENGFTERDLVLACLVSFHHFDLERALPTSNLARQKRIFTWKNASTGENVILTAFPGMTTEQFNTIIQFAKTEQWPLTPEGLFIALKKQKEGENIDPSLVETFMLTPDFWTLELLFNRYNGPIRKQTLIELILDGDWNLFKQFTKQQRQLQDISDARRQKLLLDYLKARSESAAELILQTDRDFAARKMDDAQVVELLRLLPKKGESVQFAKEMLTSPRSLSVWQQASLRLYEYAGESIPKDWNYQTSLARFAPEKISEVRPAAVEKLLIKEVVKEPVTITSPLIPAKPKILKVVNPTPLKIETKIADTKPAVPKKIAAKSSPPAPQYRLYIVQEGDSLWKISPRFGVDMEVLKQRNQIQSNAISPGTVLRIP